MLKSYIVLLFFVISYSPSWSQKINWTTDGLAYTKFKEGSLVRIDPRTEGETVLVSREQLTPSGMETLRPQSFAFSNDGRKVLFFTNTVKVWRDRTRGDYWLLDIASKRLRQVGKDRPSQSLMFAKLSPDGNQVAYVSEHNIFVEDASSGFSKKLTNDGTRKMINGTFDWVYEEEFKCQDGFRWSPDGTKIAFWHLDANKIRDYYMINTTDSPYSRIIPIEYPKAGQSPSPARIGVISVSGGGIKWMNIEGDPAELYIPRMDWVSKGEIIVQQLNRRQQESRLIYCNANDGSARTFWAESDPSWVDVPDDSSPWIFINNGQDFLWISEKDGWRHIYKISRDGKSTSLITKGNYDIGEIKGIDETNGYIYFSASPNNATQLYLYKIKYDGKSNKDEAELVSDKKLEGTHTYNISSTAKMAYHAFSSHNTPRVSEWITLPDNRPVNKAKSIANNIRRETNSQVEFFQIKTEDNILLDAWVHKPDNFDPSKKYPVVMYVYGEPAKSVTEDEYGEQDNFLYDGDMAADGYVQVGIDNRGTPVLKGAGWRKAIYRKIGDINIRDMANGFKKILELPYIDKSRTAVWGWSGGGASTLNLMFMYPDLFKTGIAIAAITNMLNYDNIYQERYMGLPQENMEDYIRNSPVTKAQGLQGDLLYIHGTGDDNVHYDNAEQLINALVVNGKQFSFMPYPNRTHGISEGKGTFAHLKTLYSNFLRQHCPPGGR
ncbi:MAG: DPP IV N-terminal domain-containing protein [Bacteroidetes bacterium]|nr:DPP IV N-terminal domain-containing protein [Bacteroidota bacterium]